MSKETGDPGRFSDPQYASSRMLRGEHAAAMLFFISLALVNSIYYIWDISQTVFYLPPTDSAAWTYRFESGSGLFFLVMLIWALTLLVKGARFSSSLKIPATIFLIAISLVIIVSCAVSSSAYLLFTAVILAYILLQGFVLLRRGRWLTLSLVACLQLILPLGFFALALSTTPTSFWDWWDPSHVILGAISLFLPFVGMGSLLFLLACQQTLSLATRHTLLTLGRIATLLVAVLLIAMIYRDFAYWIIDQHHVQQQMIIDQHHVQQEIQTGHIIINNSFTYGHRFTYGLWTLFPQQPWFQITLFHALPMAVGILGMLAAVLWQGRILKTASNLALPLIAPVQEQQSS